MSSAKKLEWSKVNLTSSYTKNGQQLVKTILNDLEGVVLGGQLLAVMGPTGCGKTSLMNVLSGRITYNKNITLSGNIYYNSEVINFREVRKMIGYVGQDETTYAFLTVRETISLSAYFHSPNSTTTEEREARVDNVIRELGLQKVIDSILGNEMQRGVSGGEYKRVLIGKELIKNPELMFLDEPTSGLDSFQAFSVMDTMKTLADRGRIIVSVIHQPRSSIFTLFDRLLLLAESKMIYFGPAREALNYFKSLGHQCPENFNPADFFLDILSVDYKTSEAEQETKARVQYLAESWEQVRNTHFFDSVQPRSSRIFESEADHLEPSKPFVNWFQDYSVLQWRCFANTFRNYPNLLVRVISGVFFAVLVALIYRDLGYTQQDIQNREGLLYFILINQGFSPLISVLNTFTSEKVIVTREVRSGSYRYSSYYVASAVSELPTLLVLTTSANACAIGFFVSSYSPNIQIANAIGPPIFIILLLFGGFYINTGSLPPGSQWVRYISLVYWGFEALVINEFVGERFTCQVGESACRTTGSEVIQYLSFEGASISESIGILIALTFGFHLLGYSGLVLARQRYAKIIPDQTEINAGQPNEHEHLRSTETKDIEINRVEYIL